MKLAHLCLPATLDTLKIVQRDEPDVRPGLVKVRWRASTLNFHDYAVVTGRLPSADGRIPLSDGAGEVVAVGDGVTQWQVGDRVISVFFPNWHEGNPTIARTLTMTGDSTDGCATQYSLVPPSALTAMPPHLGFAEAAALPCAALTAWRALVVECAIKPGDRVLVQGSGGMSLFALQFAAIAGAEIFATSSSPEKLERMRALGAHHLVDYRRDSRWGDTVRRLAGEGVDHVVDVGGASTLAQSLKATRVGANIVMVGVLGGLEAPLQIGRLIARQPRLLPIAVGSREMQLQMCRSIALDGLRPVLDRSFALSELAEAFRYQESGRHFGKIVIDLDAG
ncbi:zinc-dependent alcohol dehydrogenase family protein [Solimonas terrae]|uniref:NAD(P)-dependent alcohol dehydrogenase n=1 Tax=Solimonas terrae TaxID=1396819 RepID=A0A6M2BNY9_9GAMM|nr:NAD(P)-dependent alcohol dehydrogenase [Solimonas terrae]NGY04316.1 NAD(P)-dependent alcohol dehydrogenase [Solimonas terrae]